MATIKSIIDLQGTIQGINFYKLNGKTVAKRAAGPSAEKIRKHENFTRVRENIDEFYNGAVVVAQKIRYNFSNFKHLWEPYLSGRLNALLKKEMTSHEGERGKRPVQLRKYSRALEIFQFGPTSFTSVFSAPYSLTLNTLRNKVELHINSFNTNDFINAPEGASHFRILLGMSFVSEYIFASNGERYNPTDPETNGQNKTVASDYIGLRENISDAFLSVHLENVLPSESTAALVGMGIEFYQEVGGKMYLLKEGRGFSLIKCD